MNCFAVGYPLPLLLKRLWDIFMKKFVGLGVILFLAGCGVSDDDKQRVAALTCSIMGETRNMDSAVRVKEINAAREKIGEEPFLGGDEVIKESFENGLCETLVAYPDTYRALVAEMVLLERKRIAEESRVFRLREQERVQRVSGGPLEEWKSAILARIATVPNPIRDLRFDVKYSDRYPLKIEYVCSGFHHLDTNFIITFANELGTLRGQNSIGFCSSETQNTDLLVTDTDRENLYKVIGDREEGSLLSSVQSIDVEITGSNPSLVSANRASERSTYKYVDPKNSHEELREFDLYSNPVKLRLYEK